MKTIKIFGLSLIAVFMTVGFSACSSSSDDEDNGGGRLSIEGTWHSVSEKWYLWDKETNQPDYSDYSTLEGDTWIFKKDGDNFIWRYLYTDHGKDYDETRELIRVSDKEYTVVSKGKKRALMVFKTISSNSLVLEYYDSYYSSNGPTEYGIVNLAR